MPWSGAGVYSLPRSWSADKAGSIAPSATNFDQQDNDIASAINNCLAKDGQNAMTGTLNLNGNSVSNVANLTATGTVTVNALNVGATVTAAAASIAGTCTAATFAGSGASLTALPAAQVTGSHALPDAVLSTNIPLLNVSNTFTGQILRVNHTTPVFNLTQLGAATNAGKWRIYANAGVLVFGTLDDGETNEVQYITATRSDKFVATLALAATTLSFTGNVSTPGASASEVGKAGAPHRDVSATGSTASTDGGGTIRLTGGVGQTFTLNNNPPQDSVVIIVNKSGAPWTIAASGTLTWASGAVTGSRTLADKGMLVAWHDGSGNWYVNGGGIS